MIKWKWNNNVSQLKKIESRLFLFHDDDDDEVAEEKSIIERKKGIENCD